MAESTGSIRIKVGASADRSVEKTFGDVEKRALRARANISRSLGGVEFKQLGASATAAYGQAEKAAKRSSDASSKEAARALASQRKALDRYAKDQDRLYSRQQREAARAANAEIKQAERAQRYKIALQNRSFAEEQRNREAAEKQAARIADRSDTMRRKEAYRTAYHGVIRHFPSMLSHGARVASGLLHGAGVDFDLGSSVSRNIHRETAAVGLAQQERMATGQTIGTQGYRDIANKVGTEFKSDPSKVLELMRGFTGRSGEYKAIQGKAATELTKIAIAKGADFGETGEAAGTLFTKLKDIDSVIGVMRGLGGEAAAGMFESKDMMNRIAKISAGSYKFKGGSRENIPKLFALAEGAGMGGADNAAQAATAVDSFQAAFTKNARLKGLEKNLGHSIFADDGKTTLNDPVETLFESITKNKGNLAVLGKLWQDRNAMKVVGSYASTYNEAGGGEKGEAAMRAQYQRIAGAKLTEESENKNVADALNSTAAKAQEFQNRLDEVNMKLMTTALPALERLAPTALNVADSFGRLVGWAAENPWTAVTAAFAASIARAHIETVLRSGIESALGGGKQEVGEDGKPISKAGGGIVGAVGMGLAIGTITAAAIYTNGITDYDKTKKATDDIMTDLSHAKGAELPGAILDAKAKLKKAEDDQSYVGWALGTSDPELKSARDYIAQREKELNSGYMGNSPYAKLQAERKVQDGDVNGQADANKPLTKADLKDAFSGALANGVRIINLPPVLVGGPTVDPNGRAPTGQ